MKKRKEQSIKRKKMFMKSMSGSPEKGRCDTAPKHARMPVLGNKC